MSLPPRARAFPAITLSSGRARLTATCSAAILTGLAAPSMAQTDAARVSSHTKHPVAAPLKSAHTASSEDIRVSGTTAALNRGGGMMRVETASGAVQTVTRQYIEMQSPAGTALDYIKNLPSITVSNSDPAGFQGGQIQMRGLTDSDMALLVDGAPASSALYMNEDLDSENTDSISVTPGNSAIDLPATSAAAGVMNRVSYNPSSKFGGTIDASYGSFDLWREFARLDTGEIGHTGIKAYASFSNEHDRSWIGSGLNDRKHVDVGLRKDWENGSYIKAVGSWNGEDFTIDNYPTASVFEKYKDSGDGFGRTSTFDKSGNDYWKNNLDHWNQYYVGIPVHVALPAHLTFDATPYFYSGKGWDAYARGTSGSTYTYSDGAEIPAGTPLTGYYQQDYEYITGVTTKLSWEINRHNTAAIGYWFGYEDDRSSSPVNVTNADGSAPTPSLVPTEIFSSGVRYNPGADSGFALNSIFVTDKARLLDDKLVFDAGFKYIMTHYWYQTYGSNGLRSGAALGSNLTAPLPHVGISYFFDQHNQIYINAEGNFREPDPSSLTVTKIVGGKFPNSEYSISEELGYRYHDQHVVADVELFNYNITNRLLSTYVGAGQSATVNAGNEALRGFDIMLAGQAIHGLSPYASLEYLDGTIDSNIAAEDVNGNMSAMRTKGDDAPMAPHVMANLGLTYAQGHFFANGTLHYVSSQVVTLAGDESIPGYVTDSIALGYHFPNIGPAKSPTLRLSFENLGGEIVRTGSYGVGTNATRVRLLDGQLIASTSAADFYVYPPFTVTGTLSVSF